VDLSARNEFPIDLDELRARLMAPGDRSHRRLLKDWLDLCGARVGATVIGEKSPVHLRYTLRLADLFPGSRFVQIVRDPRDVALSHAQVWRRHSAEAAVRWNRDQSLIDRFRATLGERRFRVQRYEDLVADPEGAARALADFLDIEFTEAMIAPDKREQTGFAAREKHKLQTLEQITRSRIGRYRGKLSAGDVAVVQMICSSRMRRFGYEADPVAPFSGAAKLLIDSPGVLLNRARKRRVSNARLDQAAGLAR
jgi:hypothetical protein